MSFTDTSSDSDGTIVAWEWSFGDGATSSAQNPTHLFPADDTYIVTLMVTDDDGATDVGGRAVLIAGNIRELDGTYDTVLRRRRSS